MAVTSPERRRVRPGRPTLSVITPAFNEESNLPVLHGRLTQVLDAEGIDWEWVVVDDHSSDRSFEVVADLARRDARVRGVRLARNSGSHSAVTCGLHHARGECAAVMACDLQDPPETLPRLLERWREGAHVVWAVRARREGETVLNALFSRFYYVLMRRLAGIRDMPATGADFFLIDRLVLRAFRRFGESHVSIFALITWMGYRQASVEYTKESRLHGHSGWTLEKKLKLAVDSITAFTYTPIRFMSILGACVACLGLAYAAVTVARALAGYPPQGWASLMVVLLVSSGLQMLMLGVLGEYLWRALDEARRRPRYLIENRTRPAGARSDEARLRGDEDASTHEVGGMRS